MPEASVRKMKREYRDAEHLRRMAGLCGLDIGKTECARFWRGDFDRLKGFEAFLLMIGLKVRFEQIDNKGAG